MLISDSGLVQMCGSRRREPLRVELEERGTARPIEGMQPMVSYVQLREIRGTKGGMGGQQVRNAVVK